MQIYLANTRGMCAGVNRAITVVEMALQKYGTDTYVLHEVVHNKHVVNDLKNKGAHFVESLDEIPQGKVVIFSAHGVGKCAEQKAMQRKLKVIDATCPLVTRIHKKINKASQLGQEVIVIGHRGHQEVRGTIGQYTNDKSLVHVVENVEDVQKLEVKSDNLVFATQTTLSIDETKKTVEALRSRFANIQGPKQDDTCFATQLRQNAIKELAKYCELILVAGSKNSSNSKRLSEVAIASGCKSYLIDDYTDIDDSIFTGITKVGISAGASAPEYIVEDIISYLKNKGANDEVICIGEVPKNLSFALPDNI